LKGKFYFSFFCISKPKEPDHSRNQIWHSQQIQDANIQPRTDSSISITDVVFHGGPTHGTLSKRVGMQQQEPKGEEGYVDKSFHRNYNAGFLKLV
jgi:hypothetical protein